MNKKGIEKMRNRFLVICIILLVVVFASNGATYKYMDGKLSKKEAQLVQSQSQFSHSQAQLRDTKDSLKKLQSSIDSSVVNKYPDGSKASFKIDANKVKDIKKVMIVAHPDDETLWAGNHISNGGYLIICLTNGNNKIRSKEFDNVMKYTGNYGIILDYPDASHHVKNDWSKVKDMIIQDIDYIINYKDWDMIVTHNPDGEYGHIQHKSTSLYVSNECSKYNLTSKLYYFEKYYTTKYLQQHYIKPILTNEQIQYKNNIMTKDYPSQAYADKLFKHMIPYEQLITYEDWTFTS